MGGGTLFKNLLARLTGTQTEPEAATPDEDTSHEQSADTRVLPRWLARDDPANPFNVEGFDCAVFVNSLMATTFDTKIAESFLSLRHTIGAEHTGKLPEQAVEVPCNLRYEYQGEVADGILFKASEMEEKWDIYLYDNRLYFSRSWTGTLSFVAEMSTTGTEIVINRIWAAGAAEETDNPMAVQQVDFLIKSHLFRRAVPHPLPQNIPGEPEAVGLYSFSQYGRGCCFATYEDTLGATLKKEAAQNQE